MNASVSAPSQAMKDRWRHPTRITDNSDQHDDSEPFDLLEPGRRPQDRVVTVEWSVQGATVTAALKAHAGVVSVEQFRLDAPAGGIPAIARNLPSDRAVINAVHAAGPEARFSLQWLLGTQSRYAALGRERLAKGEPIGPSLLEDTLADYVAEVSRRPRSRIRMQIERAKVLLREQERDPSIRTRDIVARLVDEDIPQGTVWKRLNEARRELAE